MYEITSIISSLFTIVASVIAIYIFLTKRKILSSVISILINYSYQLTLSELKEKRFSMDEILDEIISTDVPF